MLRKNKTGVAGQRFVLRISEQSEIQHAAKENSTSGPHRNSVALTGGTAAPKRPMGTLVLGRGYKMRQTVLSGVPATPVLTETTGMRPESHIQPDIEDFIATIEQSTTGRIDITDREGTDERMTDVAFNEAQQRKVRKPGSKERPVYEAERETVVGSNDSGNYNDDGWDSEHTKTSKIVVDRQNRWHWREK